MAIANLAIDQWRGRLTNPMLCLIMGCAVVASTFSQQAHRQSDQGSPAHTSNPLLKTPEQEHKEKKVDQASPESSLKSRSGKQVTEEALAALKRKRELASSLLEGVLAKANGITPVEYSVLTQVEAATLLWESDRHRAAVILKKAWDRLDGLFEEQKKSDDNRPSRKQLRLRFVALRRIARLNPDLLKQFGSQKSEAQVPVLGKWTDEARAIMSVAEEQVDSDSSRAVQLAQRSLPFGLVDWVPFLNKVSQKDNAQAEQVATMLMHQLSISSVSPYDLLNLDRFALDPSRSAGVREQFFRALTFRFTQDLRAESPTETLRVGMQTAQRALQMASGNIWPGRLQEIISQYGALLSSRSVASSGAPRNVTIDISTIAPAKAGDTSEIEEFSQRVQRINDPMARDKEYQRLAGAAAGKENLSLAEELMSKIENDALRREATVSIYGPGIRKALGEADWMTAQTHALKITHPLGRTLVMDIIAQMILRSGKDKKDDAKQVYGDAIAKLQRDAATEDVAKGFLIIARSLGAVDMDRSLEAMDWAVFVLNKVAKSEEFLADSDTSRALAPWVSLPIRTLRYDEVLELTEIIGPLFKEMTKRDLNSAESTANGLSHLGLSSLAQLGIVSELQKELLKSKPDLPSADGKKTAQANK